MPEWLIVGGSAFLATAVGTGVVTPRVRRWIVRGHGPEAFDAAARLLGGAAAGLSRGWRHGIAVPAADGSIVWRGRTLPPLDLDGSSPRRPSVREWWTVSPDVEVHRLWTREGAVVEIAVHPVDAHRLRQLLRPS